MEWIRNLGKAKIPDDFFKELPKKIKVSLEANILDVAWWYQRYYLTTLLIRDRSILSKLRLRMVGCENCGESLQLLQKHTREFDAVKVLLDQTFLFLKSFLESLNPFQLKGPPKFGFLAKTLDEKLMGSVGVQEKQQREKEKRFKKGNQQYEKEKKLRRTHRKTLFGNESTYQHYRQEESKKAGGYYEWKKKKRKLKEELGTEQYKTMKRELADHYRNQRTESDDILSILLKWKRESLGNFLKIMKALFYLEYWKKDFDYVIHFVLTQLSENKVTFSSELMGLLDKNKNNVISIDEFNEYVFGLDPE